MEPRIIYEDKNFLAVDKPPGLLVHPIRLESNGAGPTASSKERTLVDWLLKRYPEIRKVGDPGRPGIVHRLDRDTSGILLIAKNQEYFEYLKNLFQKRLIKKTYRALVYGELIPKRGVVKKDIKVKSGTTKRTVFKGRGERTAVTEYRVLKYLDGFSWIEVIPLTGRTHQIRVHLSSIGHPVVGDKLYGPKNPKGVGLLNVNRQVLHAYSLEFSPALGKRLKLAVSLPGDIKAALHNFPISRPPRS